jgi:DivIVA domain-containing protein
MKVFSIERRGYSPREVDAYLSELEAQLAQKDTQLSEYRQKEAAINQSVVEAKLLANKIVEDAKVEADAIHRNALDSMADIKDKTTAMHAKLQAFQQDYNRILQQYLVAVRCSDMVQIFDDLDKFMDNLGMNQKEEAAPKAAEAKQ